MDITEIGCEDADWLRIGPASSDKILDRTSGEEFN